jgi:glycosyltransferase involved in cell wall biosynthesis
LVGDGPDRVQLEDLARSLGVSPRVQFLGAQPRQTVFEELARAAVVAIPSKRASDGDEDGVPVVLAEAMAARVPVVVSNAGGLGEHVVDGVSGWLVSSDDPEGLASALGEALTRPDESEKRAIAAYSWASEHLSATVAARQYAGLLQAAARGQAGAS